MTIKIHLIHGIRFNCISNNDDASVAAVVVAFVVVVVLGIIIEINKTKENNIYF